MSNKVSLDQFKGAQPDKVEFDAPSCEVTIDGRKYELEPKVFSTGAVGWGLQETITVHGVAVKCGLNLIVKGSKPKAGQAPVKITAGGGRE